MAGQKRKSLHKEEVDYWSEIAALEEDIMNEMLLAELYEKDEMRLIGQELESDRSNFARSEEDGWFYED